MVIQHSNKATSKDLRFVCEGKPKTLVCLTRLFGAPDGIEGIECEILGAHGTREVED
jgi:hypothetical protein